MKCLLCSSTNVKILESHPKKELADLWVDLYPTIDNELKLDEIKIYKCPTCNLKFFDPKLAGGDKFYSALGELDWYYLHPGKTEYDYVQKYIKTNNKVLDIGSGRGVLYTKTKTIIDYTGIELSTKAVQLAKNAGINVLQEDIATHAQKNQGKYDLACLFQVLEHLTELENFIQSIHLTLKSKGLFVIAVPNNDGFISYTSNYTFNLPPHHTILWTESSLKYMANKYNFDVIEVEKEFLQDVHKEAAYHAYIVSLFRKMLFLPNLLINKNSWNYRLNRVVNKLLRIKFFNIVLMNLAKKRVKDGQSIIITLQKK